MLVQGLLILNTQPANAHRAGSLHCAGLEVGALLCCPCWRCKLILQSTTARDAKKSDAVTLLCCAVAGEDTQPANAHRAGSVHCAWPEESALLCCCCWRCLLILQPTTVLVTGNSHKANFCQPAGFLTLSLPMLTTHMSSDTWSLMLCMK